MRKDFDWQIRSAAISAISKFYWKDRTVAEILLKGLEDEFFIVRQSAASGIRDTGDLQLISRILPYLEKEHEGFVKRIMREALELKGAPVPQDFKEMKEQLYKLKERVTNLEASKNSKK